MKRYNKTETEAMNAASDALVDAFLGHHFECNCAVCNAMLVLKNALGAESYGYTARYIGNKPSPKRRLRSVTGTGGD